MMKFIFMNAYSGGNTEIGLKVNCLKKTAGGPDV